MMVVKEGLVIKCSFASELRAVVHRDGLGQATSSGELIEQVIVVDC